MSNFIKVIASFLILIIISISLYFFVYQNNADVRAIKFINSNLEMRYRNELTNIGDTFKKFLDEKIKVAAAFEKEFNYQKYIDRAVLKQVSTENENRISEQLFQNDQHLKKIKFFNNSGELLYTTDPNEIVNVGKGANVTFVSADGIEKSNGIFDFNTQGEYFIKYNEFAILKRNIKINDANAGVLLFYYTTGFINDCFRNIDSFQFVDSCFIGNDVVLLNKPRNVSADQLKPEFFLDNHKFSLFVKDIANDKNIEKIFKVLSRDITGYNLRISMVFDDELFMLDKRKSMVLMYLLLFSTYLLILMVLLSGKSEINKARDRLSLFTASLLEEFINARTKDEIAAIRNSLDDKRATILKGLYINFRKLKENDKKNIEGELDSVLKRIDESFKSRIKPEYDAENFTRIEKLFERFIETIAEKGINVVSSGAVAGEKKRGKIVQKKTEEIEELEDLGEADDVEEVEELAEAESVEDAEEVEEAEYVEDAEDIEEIEEVEEAAEPEEIEEVEEAVETEEIEEVEEAVETEAIEEVEETAETEEIEEVEEAVETEEIEEVEEAVETEEIEEVDEAVETEEIEEVDEAVETEAIEEVDEAVEAEAIEEVEDTAEPEAIEEVEEAVETEEIEDAAVELNLLPEDIIEVENEPAPAEELEPDAAEIETVPGDADFLSKLESLEDITDNLKYESGENDAKKVDEMIMEYKAEKISDDFDLYIIGEEPDKKTKVVQEEDMFQKDQGEVSIEDFPIIDLDFNDDVFGMEGVTSDTFEDLLTENLEDIADKIEDLEEIEEIEEADSDDIPVVPEEFYNDAVSKDDMLAKQLEEIDSKKSELQLVIDAVYKDAQADKLSMMIHVANNDGFIQTYQIGFESNKVEKFVLSRENSIVNHMYMTERMVFVSEISKIKSMFKERDFESEFYGVDSMIIYPIKILGKVRALLFLGYKNDGMKLIEPFINSISKYKEEINKGILKLI